MTKLRALIISLRMSLMLALGTIGVAVPTFADSGPYSFTPHSGGSNWITHTSGNSMSIICDGCTAIAKGKHLTAGDLRATLTDHSRFWDAVSNGHSKLHEVGNYSQCWTKSGSDLIMANCVQGASNQQWLFYCQSSDCNVDSHWTIVNPASGKSVGVFGLDDGRPVYVENQASGFYVGWIIAGGV